MTMNSEKRKIEKKQLRQMFWRSCQLDVSWNFERQQNMAYSYAMAPVVEKLHKDNKEKRQMP